MNAKDYWQIGDEVVDFSKNLSGKIADIFDGILKIESTNTIPTLYKAYNLYGQRKPEYQRTLWHKDSFVQIDGAVIEFVPEGRADINDMRLGLNQ